MRVLVARCHLTSHLRLLAAFLDESLVSIAAALCELKRAKLAALRKAVLPLEHLDRGGGFRGLQCNKHAGTRSGTCGT